MYNYEFEFSVKHRFVVKKQSLDPLHVSQLEAAAKRMLTDKQALEWAEIEASTNGKLILSDEYTFEKVKEVYIQPEYDDTQPIIRQ